MKISLFEKESILSDADNLRTYLDIQAEMMQDKFSEKYKRMKSMVKIISALADEYEILMKENKELIIRVIGYGGFDEQEIEAMEKIEIAGEKPKRKTMRVEEVMHMKEVLNK